MVLAPCVCAYTCVCMCTAYRPPNTRPHNPPPLQYLIQDLGIATALAAFMAMGRPQLELTPQRPPQRLVAASVLAPVAALCTLVLTWQVAALGLLRQQPWYVAFDPQQQRGACFAVQEKNKGCTAVRGA